MELNPYAKFLNGRDPIEVVASTPGKIIKLASQVPTERPVEQSPVGAWNARDIIAHLADSELVFGFRLRQTLAEDHPILQPFDQNLWATRYANYDTTSALSLFAASRNWNMLLIHGTDQTDRMRPATHPERGTMTFWTIVETMAGHDINHLLQIERLTTG